MNLNSINSRLRVPLGGAMALALFAALPARAGLSISRAAQDPAGYWRLNETTPPRPPVTTAVNLGSLGATGNGTYNGCQGFFRGFPGALAKSDTAVHFDGTQPEHYDPYNAPSTRPPSRSNLGLTRIHRGELRLSLRVLLCQSALRLAYLSNRSTSNPALICRI